MNITINNLTINVNSMDQMPKGLTKSISDKIETDTTTSINYSLLPYGTFVESEGGYYVGLIKSDFDNKTYAIFHSPQPKQPIKKTFAVVSSNKGTIECQYLSDGYMNTANIYRELKGEHKFEDTAIYFVKTTIVNELSDWYIPSMLELELCYRNLKPTDNKNKVGYGENNYAVPVGKAYTENTPNITLSQQHRYGNKYFEYDQAFDTGYYWSSTAMLSHEDGFAVQNTNAQRFYNGEITTARIFELANVIFVRRVLVSE